ncbi:elongation factor P [Stratiformator vulcanicus]|uniref:Elongation factor P n=1 Tax=Stratiformator vulcanicus TaxID=2527980 RepID=A0A517R050_9PLAN|nr:elongation factor P [Stratiformator vulcanicus]QDT37276.1 Elongation factor P [Stratiformator vulcanicus]
MATVNVNDFRKGLKLEVEGEPYEIIEVNFVKPGKGQALYKTKLRNLLRGGILDRTFRSGDSLDAADIQKTTGQYLYRDGDSYVFMESQTFEQYALPTDSVADKMRFIQENAEVDLLLYNGNVIDMTPPQHMMLSVTYTEPAARGDTATNVTKPATVEGGAEVQVPAFIQEGNVIKIDTASGSYVERVKN